MSTTVKQFIEMLSKQNLNLELVLDPFITDDDISAPDTAYAIIHGDKDSILNLHIRESQAESDRDDDKDFGGEDVLYGFDEWEDPLDKRKCLVISYQFLNAKNK